MCDQLVDYGRVYLLRHEWATFDKLASAYDPTGTQKALKVIFPDIGDSFEAVLRIEVRLVVAMNTDQREKRRHQVSSSGRGGCQVNTRAVC